MSLSMNIVASVAVRSVYRRFAALSDEDKQKIIEMVKKKLKEKAEGKAAPEKPSQEPAEKPAEESIEEVDDWQEYLYPDGNPAEDEKPKEEKPAEEPAEKPKEEPPKEKAPAEAPKEQPKEEKPAEKPVEKPEDKPAEKSEEPPKEDEPLDTPDEDGTEIVPLQKSDIVESAEDEDMAEQIAADADEVSAEDDTDVEETVDNLALSAIALHGDTVEERVSGWAMGELQAARGLQLNRKDKDTMTDTGGTSKKPEPEPELKPPRDDLKKPFRTHDKPAEERDIDTDKDPDKRVASLSRHCHFYKASNGRWYMELAHREHGDRNDATTYGPFETRDKAIEYLDEFSNPGGWSEDRSGKNPPPTESPNGDKVEAPDYKNEWWRSPRRYR